MIVEGPERFTGGCLCGSVRIVAPGHAAQRNVPPTSNSAGPPVRQGGSDSVSMTCVNSDQKA